MDKKNTMLLTVIAVATLLVAVVGATFAFFAVSNPSDATTTAKAEAKKVPSFVINPDQPNLNMVLSAEDMKQSEAEDVPYYAVSGTSGTHELSKQDLTIATMTRTGGEDADKYKCSVTVTVTVDNTEMLDALKTDNANLYLNGLGLSSEKLDLTTLKTTSNTKSYTNIVNFDTPGASNKLTADLEIINSHDDDQSGAAGQTLNVTVKTSATNCELYTE